VKLVARGFAGPTQATTEDAERTPGVRCCRAYRSLRDSCLQTLGAPQRCETGLSAKTKRGLSGLRQREGRSDYIFTVLRLATGLILLALVSVYLLSSPAKGAGYPCFSTHNSHSSRTKPLMFLDLENRSENMYIPSVSVRDEVGRSCPN
jgi:hypothetical protein